MRNLKKAAAVLLTAAMTMSASIMAFADQTVTFHFQNAKGWENVGAHIYEGVGFTTNVTPLDKCFVTSTDDDGNAKAIWPGAKMEAEGGDWYKVTATFTNVEENGLALIFNNGVGDVEANDVGFSEADAEAVKASGIPNTTNATKEQTGNITLGKKAIAKIEGGMPSDLYITYDGKTTELLTEAPESYTSAVSTTSTDTSSNTTSTDSSNSTGTASADTTATGSTTNSSSTTAPKTGDAVAVSVVALGALAAVAFVASKKRVNG